MRDNSYLKKQLQTANGLHRIYKEPDFQNHLLPHLRQLATVEHIDPSKFKTREEYYFALDNANQEARVYAEFLHFLERQEGTIKALMTELKKIEVSYEQ